MKRFGSILFFVFAVSVFCLSFYLQRHFMNNFDENDHLTVAYFMSQGRLLYRDIFSHHFPLPYYWTYLFTPFWNFSAPSQLVSVFRLSTLALYLSNFALILLVLKNYRSRFAFSLWIFSLSFFFTLYHGNLVLSETYAAIFISSLFWLSLPQLLGWERSSSLHLLSLILLTSAAFWTQPLLIFLFIIPFLFYPKKIFQTGLFLLFLNLTPLILFYFSRQLSDFYQQGIWFNFSVYPKFFVDDQNYLSFFSHEFSLFTKFSNILEVSQFILHLSFMYLIYLIVRLKKPLPIIAVFLLFLASRIREVKIVTGSIFNFGIYPFLLLCLSSLCLSSVINFLRRRFLSIALLPIFILLSFSLSWPIILNSIKPGFNYEVFWGHRQRVANIISTLSRPNEPILIYPHDIYYYALSRRLSPDRFVYWFPWIDSVPSFRQERLSALKIQDIPVIYLGDLTFKNQPNYYHQYFPGLTESYFPVIRDGQETGVWLKIAYRDRLNLL